LMEEVLERYTFALIGVISHDVTRRA
jgi:hypothetical protein